MIDYYGNEITWVPKLEAHEGHMYERLAMAIEKDIQEGTLLHGTKMPPQRVIANYLEVNHGTVTRAYKLCEEKGLLKGVIGKGTFVSGSAGLPVELLTDHDDSGIISLGMTLPLYGLNHVLKKYLTDMAMSIDYNIALKYCPPEGHIKHRYIAANWLRKRDIEVEADDVLVCSGAQNALAVVLTTLFNKGDRILVDEFTYTGLMTLAKYLGIILVPVGGKNFVMDPEELRTVCRRESPKGLYIMPDCHNPSASSMDMATREAIAEIVREENLLCVEDGTYGFTVKEQLLPVSVLAPEQCFYIHGSSKAISPAFRIAYLAAPKRFVSQLRQGINNLTWMASPYNAEILSLLQSTGQYETLVGLKLQELNERNQMFDALFEGYHTVPSETSMFRIILIPEHYNETEIERRAIEAGVQVFGINRFMASAQTKIKGIRISVSSPKNQGDLMKGMTIIKQIIDEYEMDYNLVI